MGQEVGTYWKINFTLVSNRVQEPILNDCLLPAAVLELGRGTGEKMSSSTSVGLEFCRQREGRVLYTWGGVAGEEAADRD